MMYDRCRSRTSIASFWHAFPEFGNLEDLLLFPEKCLTDLDLSELGSSSFLYVRVKEGEMLASESVI